MKILDIKIDLISKKELLQKFEQFLSQKKTHIICTVNTEFIVSAQSDPIFKDILNNKSSINVADGIGVLWAAKFMSFKKLDIPVISQIATIFQWLFSIILIPIIPRYFKKPIPERLAGADLVWDIAEIANRGHYKIFLLGGSPTAAERTALKLQTDIYGLKIAGIHSGNPETDTDEMVEAINHSGADIVLVAFGHPKQEKWLDSNLKKINCKICIGIGGTFDFIAGIRKRAPKFFRNSGLEWAYRLFQEPRRIRRQTSILTLLGMVLKEKLKD